MFENIKRGVYEVGGKQIFFRSEWEWKYACYLEFLKKHKEIKEWTYEEKTFEFPIKHGTTRYTPDFCVYKNNGDHEWVECKGYWTSKGKTQVKRFKKYFPKEKLIIIDGDFFKAIKRKGQERLIYGR